MLPPLFIDSVAELKNLSAAIASFQHCYDDLRSHLDSIKATISSKLLPETPRVTPVAPFSPKPGVSDSTELKTQEQESNPLVSDLYYLCQTMCGRGLRKYLVTHLSNIAWMREEVPRALRLAPNPPKLVLESMGKFYLLSGKAISMNPKSHPSREASVFILECFLLMMGMDSGNGKENGGLSIEKEVMVEAEEATLAWWKRMAIDEVLSMADQIDARGLLFLIACFGIPSSLNGCDIRALLAAADAREIAGVLRNSHLLMYKISEIVLEMLKHNMDVDAVNLVYTFGLEERFDPQIILVSYLQELKESSKTAERWEQDSAALNETIRKQLAALKSVGRCLERHNVDPAKLLPGWRIDEMIASLRNDFDDDWPSEDRPFLHRNVSETETPRKPITSHKPKFGRGPQQFKTSGRGRGKILGRGRGNCGPCNYSGGAMADRGGRVKNNGINPYVWHRDAGESFPAGVGSIGSYTTVEGFAGVQEGPDIFQFADDVGENQLSHSPNLHRG